MVNHTMITRRGSTQLIAPPPPTVRCYIHPVPLTIKSEKMRMFTRNLREFLPMLKFVEPI